MGHKKPQKQLFATLTPNQFVFVYILHTNVNACPNLLLHNNMFYQLQQTISLCLNMILYDGHRETIQELGNGI